MAERKVSMATQKWRRECVKYYKFYMHKELDKEVLEWFEKKTNKRQYLIDLIRKDMNENNATGEKI